MTDTKPKAKREKAQLFVLIGALLIFVCAGVGKCIYEGNLLRHDFCYVIAKVDYITDTENGVNYSIHYNYLGKEYRSGIKGFIKVYKDSLWVLKISKTDPEVWKYVDSRVFECVKNDPASMNTSWIGYPDCP